MRRRGIGWLVVIVLAGCGGGSNQPDGGSVGDGSATDGGRDAGCSGWIQTPVDEDGDVGEFAALALDSSGAPAIAYFSATDSSIRYAWRTASGWSSETVAPSVGQGESIGLVFDGTTPHVVYYAYSGTGTLMHAVRTGSGWSSEPIDTADPGGAGTSASLTIAGGVLHTAYLWLSGTSGEVRWAKSSNSGWTHETVADVATSGARTAIAVSASGVPHVAFLDRGGTNIYDVEHAVRGSSMWAVDPVATAGTFPEPVAVAIDSSGAIHIAYFDSSGSLMHAVSGSTWKSNDVDSGGVGFGASMVLAGDTPHFSYYNANTGDLYHAVQVGSGYSVEPVQTEVDVGQRTSIAVDANGHVSIAYRDITHSSLMIAESCP